jgi:hypothetical protein
MNEQAPIAVKAIHYQITAAVGLGLICLGTHWQGMDIPNIFLAAVGVWMILFPRPRIPLVFLLLVALVQLSAHYEIYGTFGVTPEFTMFEPTTLVLSGGIMIFLCSQYRLLALKWHIAPYDPRFAKAKTRDDVGRPVAPLTRSESAIGPDEIIRVVVNSALCVLLGQLGWEWLSQNWRFAGLKPQFMQIAFLIWFGFTGLFIGAGIVGYWRRAHSDADLARLYLQEVDWREARREYGRIGRWIAWGKRKIAPSRKR